MTDAELNAAVAREVMRWPSWDEGVTLPDDPSRYPNYLIEPVDGAILVARRKHDGRHDWSPATSIANAVNDVVGEMSERDEQTWNVFCDQLFLAAMDVRDRVRDVRGYSPLAVTLRYLSPRVICEAALAAVRSEA